MPLPAKSVASVCQQSPISTTDGIVLRVSASICVRTVVHSGTMSNQMSTQMSTLFAGSSYFGAKNKKTRSHNAK